MFTHAKTLGLGSVPHAGEVAGAASVRGALESLRGRPAPARHPRRGGSRASSASSPTAAPSSTSARSRTSARAPSLASHDHPLPRLVAAGVLCSISTDDPAMFDTDLSRDYEAATSFGLDPRSFYDAGVAGALCDVRDEAAAPADRGLVRLARRLQSLDFPAMAIAREAEPVGSLSEVREAGLDRGRPPRHLPQHARHARRRGARSHPLPPGQDSRLVLHGPRQRGGRGRRRDGDGPGGRRHAAAPRHGRAHRARRRAVADLRAVHGPRRRADARPRRQRAHGRRAARPDRDGQPPAGDAPGRGRLRARVPHPRGAARRASAGSAKAHRRAATRTSR